LVNALKRVDFPTLGKPTMPHFKLMTNLKNWCQSVFDAGPGLTELPGLA
jgi:hypothetical protein